MALSPEAEQLTQKLIDDNIPADKAAEYVALFRALIKTEIIEREPVFLHTR